MTCRGNVVGSMEALSVGRVYLIDGLHPSIAGSSLAAAVMYAKLYAKSPVGLPAALRLHSGATVSVEKDLAALLQAAAAEVTGT